MHINNIQQATHKFAVWIISEKQIPCFSNQGGIGLREARGAQSQPIAAQVGIWMDRGILPSGKYCIHILYIPVARMRTGMYYRLQTHPAAILVGFWARAYTVIWGAAFAALVDPASLAR